MKVKLKAYKYCELVKCIPALTCHLDICGMVGNGCSELQKHNARRENIPTYEITDFSKDNLGMTFNLIGLSKKFFYIVKIP